MAQHLNIKKVFEFHKIQKIADVIHRDFARSYGMLTSSKYKYLYTDETTGLDIYSIDKKIPAGMVWGNRANFEIHHDRKNRKVVDIFFVA